MKHRRLLPTERRWTLVFSLSACGLGVSRKIHLPSDFATPRRHQARLGKCEIRAGDCSICTNAQFDFLVSNIETVQSTVPAEITIRLMPGADRYAEETDRYSGSHPGSLSVSHAYGVYHEVREHVASCLKRPDRIRMNASVIGARGVARFHCIAKLSSRRDVRCKIWASNTAW